MNKIITLASLVLLLLAVWHFSSAHDDIEEELSEPIDKAESDARAEQYVPIGTGESAIKRKNLPDIALPHHASAMLRSASEGNKEAACKIAQLLTKCRDMQEQGGRRILSSPVGLLASRDAISAGNQQAMECGGMPNISANEVIASWRRAAEMGEGSSARFYVTGRPFRLNDTIESLDELAAFRRNAEQIALEAAASGDATVALGLADAYYPWQDRSARKSLLGQAIVKKSASRSLAIYERVASGLQVGSETHASLLRERLATLRQKSSALEIAEARTLYSNWKPLSYVVPPRSEPTTDLCGPS